MQNENSDLFIKEYPYFYKIQKLQYMTRAFFFLKFNLDVFLVKIVSPLKLGSKIRVEFQISDNFSGKKCRYYMTSTDAPSCHYEIYSGKGYFKLSICNALKCLM